MKARVNKRRVLGIDPGYDRCGIAVIEGDPSKPVHVWSDCIVPKKGPASERLAELATAIQKAFKKHAPDALAIEKLFFSKNVTTGLGVAEARGVALAAAGLAGIPVLEVSPQEVKLAVTGYGAADKKAVAAMVPRLLSLPSKKRLDDELDAIAVAIAGLSTRGS